MHPDDKNWIPVDDVFNHPLFSAIFGGPISLMAAHFSKLQGEQGEWTSTKATYNNEPVYIGDSPGTVLQKLNSLESKAACKKGFDIILAEELAGSEYHQKVVHQKVVEKARKASDQKTTAEVVKELSDLADFVSRDEIVREFNKNKKWYEK